MICVRLLFDLPKAQIERLHQSPQSWVLSRICIRCHWNFINHVQILCFLLYLYLLFFPYFFHFSCLFLCALLCCVNGERLRSQAKSHKTHSSNPQSHSSWVIYLTLSVMDKYYVAPNALDPKRRRVRRAALAEALQRQQKQLQQGQMATDTTTATVCVYVWGKNTERIRYSATRKHVVLCMLSSNFSFRCMKIASKLISFSVPHRTQVNCNAAAFHHCSNRANLHTHLSFCIHSTY